MPAVGNSQVTKARRWLWFVSNNIYVWSRIIDNTLLLLDPHGHDTGSHAAHGPESNGHKSDEKEVLGKDYEDTKAIDAVGQVIGVAVLEFGVMLHR
ncbi:hypothetical protein C0992_007659 [Termitomyces sp. T32_za158]|nr:hypothetical protein C0992_007659 [Termitomyces sp. T32_za158]